MVPRVASAPSSDVGRGTRSRVVVYDPDGVNPYGRELAAQLAARYDVTVVIPGDAEWRPRGVRVLPVLPYSRGAAVAAQALRLVRGWLVVLGLALGRAQWVVVWSRRDSFVLALVARLRRVHVVLHNPGPRDTLPPRLKRAATTLVVHAPSLAVEGAAVCAHPLYTHWLADHSGAPRARSTGPIRLLLLGAARPDKGDGVPDLPDGVTLVVCGKRPPVSGPNVEDRTSRTFVPDAVLAETLLSCDALLAPYTGATQSGTVALAVTAGLPVVGYDSGAVADLAGRNGLVSIGDDAALSTVIERVRDLPRPPVDPEATLRDWTRVLG